MHRTGKFTAFFQALFLAFFTFSCASSASAEVTFDRLGVSGVFLNAHRKPVKDVRIEILVNGRTIKPQTGNGEISSGSSGAFYEKFLLPSGTFPEGMVEVRAKKPSWVDLKPTGVKVLDAGFDQEGNRLFEAVGEFTLSRQVTPAFWLAALILLIVYVIISFDWMHRSLAAVLAAALILFITYTAGSFDKAFYILSFEDAMAAIDLNVIFLLLGMMIFVGVLKKTGIFQYMAYKSYLWSKGNAFVISFILQLLTAVTSAFLDNVTVMLMVIPVTIEIALTLKVDPLTFLVPQVFASNLGGAATLIGDPPNILIGSYAGLTFGQFAANLSLICLLCLIVSNLYFLWWHRKEYKRAKIIDVETTIADLKEMYRITDRKLLIQGFFILGLTILLFFLHGLIGMPVSVAALIGSMLLLAVSGVDIVEMLENEIEWPSLLFFIGLFVIIAGAEATGLIQWIADILLTLSGGSPTVAAVIILWGSAIASAFIDNIPFTTTMLPIVLFLSESFSLPRDNILWWSLCLGACLGGNGTLIGASANLVTVGLAERAGYKISFLNYIKTCWWPMMITVTISMIYLLVAY